MSNYVTPEELTTIISNCNFKPSSRKLLITMNEYKLDNDIELVSTEEVTLDDWQYVVANGRNSEYQAGTKVYLDLAKLVKREPDPNDRYKVIEKINVQPFVMGDKSFALIDDSIVAGHIQEGNEDEINFKA